MLLRCLKCIPRPTQSSVSSKSEGDWHCRFDEESTLTIQGEKTELTVESIPTTIQGDKLETPIKSSNIYAFELIDPVGSTATQDAVNVDTGAADSVSPGATGTTDLVEEACCMPTPKTILPQTPVCDSTSDYGTECVDPAPLLKALMAFGSVLLDVRTAAAREAEPLPIPSVGCPVSHDDSEELEVMARKSLLPQKSAVIVIGDDARCRNRAKRALEHLGCERVINGGNASNIKDFLTQNMNLLSPIR